MRQIICFPSYWLEIIARKKITDLIGFAERDNLKRSYLFVSKVLGKHYPVKPKLMNTIFNQLCRLVSRLQTEDNHLVIGMGETATGLGWGFFEKLPSTNKLYIHTTRFKLNKKILIEFKESHSHDVNHYVYYPTDPAFVLFLQKVRTVYIVDDESTTGQTIYNLSKEIRKRIPGCVIIPIALVRWNPLSSVIDTHAIVTGTFKLLNNPTKEDQVVAPVASAIAACKHQVQVNEYGRLGTDRFFLDEKILPSDYKRWRSKKILVLGTGEFNYIAFKVARLLDSENDVYVQSTTRSPVKLGGIITSKIVFQDNYEPCRKAYLYNVDGTSYDIILLLAETTIGSVDPQLIRQLKLNYQSVYIIYC
jgi:hypothetical protein